VKSLSFIAGNEWLPPIPVEIGRVGAIVVIKVKVRVMRVERVVKSAVTSGPPQGLNGPAPPSGLHKEVVADLVAREVLIDVISGSSCVVGGGTGDRTGPTGPTGESEPSAGPDKSFSTSSRRCSRASMKDNGSSSRSSRPVWILRISSITALPAVNDGNGAFAVVTAGVAWAVAMKSFVTVV
jgi:hypothetical protein